MAALRDSAIGLYSSESPSAAEEAAAVEHTADEITAAAAAGLAACLRGLGRLDLAEDLYRRALAAQEHLHGHEHPLTAAAISELGKCLHDIGEGEEAERLHRLV